MRDVRTMTREPNELIWSYKVNKGGREMGIGQD